MKNKLVDLNNILFEQIERINDDALQGDELKEQINKAKEINALATTIVQNGCLMLNTMKFRNSIGDAEVDTPNLLKNE